MGLIEDIKKLHQWFVRRGYTLSVAESCTGGALSHLITEVPGASRFFLGGIVAYDVRIKTDILGVPEETIERHSVVSAECALEMARAVKRLFGSTHGIATTGNLGPEAQGGRPVGEVYVGISTPEGEDAIMLSLHAERRENKAEVVKKAINIFLERIAKT
ncbi:MAG: CinA family protein [Nitrospirae bacterium]|nr:MAG: CinA family protein [Nitrospirota bacterium]